MICTVAVIPAARWTLSGTSSICTRTGIRWARRTQVKMGLTEARPCGSGMALETVIALAMPLTCAPTIGAVTHQLDFCGIADPDRADIELLEVAIDPKRIGVDHGDFVLSDSSVIANPDQ